MRVTLATPVDGKAELNVLVKPDGSIADVRFGNGDEAMRALFSLVQSTTYPMQFPDDAIAQLPLELGIQCRSVPSECLAGILPAQSWRK